MLQLNGVFKTFNSHQALSNVDLSIAGGGTTVLIGPSGCGKSTLLKLVMGLTFPDRGDIVLNGQRVDPRTALTMRRKIGYVIQEGGLFPHLTARQNISLMARYLGWKKEDISARLKDLLEITQLPASLLDHYPLQLSGGQRQRISLMRALMLDPQLLLLDEPLGALDPMIRADLQSELKNIFLRLKKTVLLVTHDMGEAAWFGDSIVLMRAGRVVQQGTLNQLLRQPSDPFVNQFITAQRKPLEKLFG